MTHILHQSTEIRSLHVSNMARLRCNFLVFIFLFTLKGVYPLAIENDSIDTIDKLLERIDRLELRLETSDAVNKALISDMRTEHEQEVYDLKLKMKEMETSFNDNVAVLEGEIERLKNGPHQELVDQTEQTEHGNDDTKVLVEGPKRIRRQESIARQYREFPEQEVAFYATHTDHDVHNLGTGQILLFQQAHTNVGNAYNSNTGVFTAPVDGLYVFHATIMARDANDVPSHHIHAHINIDGAPYSKFFATDYDQSSQMLVINVKAGQSVSVKNDTPGDGFVGQHYSTFSGFLLYQHYQTVGVVGK